MTWLRLFFCSLIIASLAACATPGPRFGCVLACANEREVLRAKAFLQPTLPARILRITFAGTPMGHVVLVFRLDHGWFFYDDGTGTTRLTVPEGWQGFPPPLAVARLACPNKTVREAGWLD